MQAVKEIRLFNKPCLISLFPHNPPPAGKITNAFSHMQTYVKMKGLVDLKWQGQWPVEVDLPCSLKMLLQ